MLDEFFTAAHMTLADAWPLCAAVVAYTLFLCVVVVQKTGRGESPMLRINGLHLRLTPLYLAIALTPLIVWGPRDTLLHELIGVGLGLFVYLGLHYAIVSNFFAIAYGSVSGSLVSIMHAGAKPLSPTELADRYANGQGFAFIKKSRLDRLNSFLGWIKLAQRPTGEVAYTLTPKGKNALRTTRRFLKIWGLTQLGDVDA